MTKFRKGDVVLVQAVVASDYHGADAVKIDIPRFGETYAPLGNVKMLHPRIEVGDTVWADSGTGTATVLAIEDDHAWVSFGDGNYATWWISKVVRVDPDPVKVEELPVDPEELAVAS
ncbi:hypothetical protein [Phyllobacterium chamaecytisi]|uniref:hypothetical protein n=1 Tax=Phyllobacterium chamaecytisi TaxID=2876082 RepID=UPI001CCB486A|nr:hypothetical protein [Phyllobacterium sp. KW56]MBZ9600708.1 hypothetical protein [Phyllobacterium sp. KW56]